MNPVFSEYGLQELLPLKLDIPDEGCTRPNRSMYCFEAGESFQCKSLPMQTNDYAKFDYPKTRRVWQENLLEKKRVYRYRYKGNHFSFLGRRISLLEQSRGSFTLTRR